MTTFATKLLRWFAAHGRHDLPWQTPAGTARNPYHVWLSEVMLQQTQVATVIPYFRRFIERFPTLEALSVASEDEVLSAWSGLGYYSRGRNLLRAAKSLAAKCSSSEAVAPNKCSSSEAVAPNIFPQAADELQTLPGIGRSTANAIAAQAFGQRVPILDGNVKRVLARQLALTAWPGSPAAQIQLWAHAESLLPADPSAQTMADYTQAMMDLGALLCARKPHCARCPVADSCASFQQNLHTQIPVPKPKRERPLRTVFWLVIENERGEFLLERRGPSGIWGGLLSFLECDSLNTATLDERVTLADEPPLAPIRHEFSHFSLVATPVRARLRAGLHDERLQWSAPGVGSYPAPVKKLLHELSRTQG
jgi:A/G-specific adenine glycosylase